MNTFVSTTGKVMYIHNRGETTGSFAFKFSVSGPDGSQLVDQDFYITVLGELSSKYVCFCITRFHQVIGLKEVIL